MNNFEATVLKHHPDVYMHQNSFQTSVMLGEDPTNHIIYNIMLLHIFMTYSMYTFYFCGKVTLLNIFLLISGILYIFDIELQTQNNLM